MLGGLCDIAVAQCIALRQTLHLYSAQRASGTDTSTYLDAHENQWERVLPDLPSLGRLGSTAICSMSAWLHENSALAGVTHDQVSQAAAAADPDTSTLCSLSLKESVVLIRDQSAAIIWLLSTHLAAVTAGTTQNRTAMEVKRLQDQLREEMPQRQAYRAWLKQNDNNVTMSSGQAVSVPQAQPTSTAAEHAPAAVTSLSSAFAAPPALQVPSGQQHFERHNSPQLQQPVSADHGPKLFSLATSHGDVPIHEISPSRERQPSLLQRSPMALAAVSQHVMSAYATSAHLPPTSGLLWHWRSMRGNGTFALRLVPRAVEPMYSVSQIKPLHPTPGDSGRIQLDAEVWHRSDDSGGTGRRGGMASGRLTARPRLRGPRGREAAQMDEFTVQRSVSAPSNPPPGGSTGGALRGAPDATAREQMAARRAVSAMHHHADDSGVAMEQQRHASVSTVSPHNRVQVSLAPTSGGFSLAQGGYSSGQSATASGFIQPASAAAAAGITGTYLPHPGYTGGGMPVINNASPQEVRQIMGPFAVPQIAAQMLPFSPRPAGLYQVRHDGAPSPVPAYMVPLQMTPAQVLGMLQSSLESANSAKQQLQAAASASALEAQLQAASRLQHDLHTAMQVVHSLTNAVAPQAAAASTAGHHPTPAPVANVEILQRMGPLLRFGVEPRFVLLRMHKSIANAVRQLRGRDAGAHQRAKMLVHTFTSAIYGSRVTGMTAALYLMHVQRNYTHSDGSRRVEVLFSDPPASPSSSDLFTVMLTPLVHVPPDNHIHKLLSAVPKPVPVSSHMGGGAPPPTMPMQHMPGLSAPMPAFAAQQQHQPATQALPLHGIAPAASAAANAAVSAPPPVMQSLAAQAAQAALAGASGGSSLAIDSAAFQNAVKAFAEQLLQAGGSGAAGTPQPSPTASGKGAKGGGKGGKGKGTTKKAAATGGAKRSRAKKDSGDAPATKKPRGKAAAAAAAAAAAGSSTPSAPVGDKGGAPATPGASPAPETPTAASAPASGKGKGKGGKGGKSGPRKAASGTSKPRSRAKSTKGTSAAAASASAAPSTLPSSHATQGSASGLPMSALSGGFGMSTAPGSLMSSLPPLSVSTTVNGQYSRSDMPPALLHPNPGPGAGLAAAMDEAMAGRTGNTPRGGYNASMQMPTLSGQSVDLTHSLGGLPLGGPQSSPGLANGANLHWGSTDDQVPFHFGDNDDLGDLQMMMPGRDGSALDGGGISTDFDMQSVGLSDNNNWVDAEL